MKTKTKAAKSAPVKPATKQDKPVAKPAPQPEPVASGERWEPKPGSVAARVFEICDNLRKELSRPPSRKEVVAASLTADPPLNMDSVSMRYFNWRKRHKIPAHFGKAAKVAKAPTAPAKPAQPAPAAKEAKPAPKPASKPTAAKKTATKQATKTPAKKAAKVATKEAKPAATTPPTAPVVPPAPPVAPPAPPAPPAPAPQV
jgi:hypothetical protein